MLFRSDFLGIGGLGTGGGIIGSFFHALGFAGGGEPPVGQPSIVGENGPELFIPKNSGTIVPNGQFGAMGMNTNVTYNINAVDAMSFKQMLAADPTFLYAVSEQGRRRVPGG